MNPGSYPPESVRARKVIAPIMVAAWVALAVLIVVAVLG